MRLKCIQIPSSFAIGRPNSFGNDVKSKMAPLGLSQNFRVIVPYTEHVEMAPKMTQPATCFQYKSNEGTSR